MSSLSLAIFDTHCHYNLEPLFSEGDQAGAAWLQHWSEAQEHGVVGSVVVGTSLDTSTRAVELASQTAGFWSSVGIHPSHAVTEPELVAAAAALEHLLQASTQKNFKIVAIGEVGLDYFRLPSDPAAAAATQHAQRQNLLVQLELANKYQLPVILHVRDHETPESPVTGNAYWDTLALLDQHYLWHKPVVLHCVSGPLAYVTQLVHRGAFVGVAGNVSYASAEPIRNIVSHVPSNRLLLETDAPYLPPKKYRGQVCQPWMIADTAEFVTNQFSVTSPELLSNTQAFFNIAF